MKNDTMASTVARAYFPRGTIYAADPSGLRVTDQPFGSNGDTSSIADPNSTSGCGQLGHGSLRTFQSRLNQRLYDCRPCRSDKSVAMSNPDPAFLLLDSEPDRESSPFGFSVDGVTTFPDFFSDTGLHGFSL